MLGGYQYPFIEAREISMVFVDSCLDVFYSFLEIEKLLVELDELLLFILELVFLHVAALAVFELHLSPLPVYCC